MNEKQISAWRMYLYNMFGAYAFLMPVSEIEGLRGKYQAAFDRLSASKKEPIPQQGNCRHNVRAKYCRICNK